jgi:hypothetical protein
MRTNPDINLIIQPLEHGPPMPRDHEKRRDKRWPYRVMQFVAFHDVHEQPSKLMLQSVRCHDISLGGISFYLDAPPPRQNCTIILGRSPELIYVRARVVHSEKSEVSRGEWVVGCEFVTKLEAFPMRDV